MNSDVMVAAQYGVQLRAPLYIDSRGELADGAGETTTRLLRARRQTRTNWPQGICAGCSRAPQCDALPFNSADQERFDRCAAGNRLTQPLGPLAAPRPELHRIVGVAVLGFGGIRCHLPLRRGE